MSLYTLPQALYGLDGIKKILSLENNAILHKKLDQDLVNWVNGGTFNGKWGDVDVKDKKFSIKGISTTTINQEGKILFQKDYYDMYGFMKQLGLLK